MGDELSRHSTICTTCFIYDLDHRVIPAAQTNRQQDPSVNNSPSNDSCCVVFWSFISQELSSLLCTNLPGVILKFERLHCIVPTCLARRHTQVLSVLFLIPCKSLGHSVVGGIKSSETRSEACLFFFPKCSQPENSLPESCLYDLAAVVVHHGSGWVDAF